MVHKHNNLLNNQSQIKQHHNFFLLLLKFLDIDEYKEFEKQEYYIHKNLEKYIHDYVEHVNGHVLLHIKQFERKYKYSTLKYFHQELGIIAKN